MTSENPQIQALIQQIDEVLNKTNPRLPWVMSSDAVQQRQVLEQTRSYLLSLQQNSGLTETVNAEPGTAQSATAMEASAQQVLQAVVQEMNYLRSNMMQPLRSDVEILRLQRDALTQEIRQLEMQRQQYGLPQQTPHYLTEFLQAAMTQMQENLAGQVAQMLATQVSVDPQRLAGMQAAGLLESGSSTLSPVERLEHLQQLQAQSDQLILRLDTTLRTVFESLQSNLQSYQDSLEEGLGRMHGMGQQGEAVFGAFVTRLGQILGREASSFLQSPQARSDRPSLPGQKPAADNRPDSQIHRLLEELNALDQTALHRSVPGEPIPFGRSARPEVSPEIELENLAELDRVLSQLDLSVIPEADDLDEDLVVLSEDEEFPFAAPTDARQEFPRRTVETDPDAVRRADQMRTDADLESAIDLLNQITAETTIDAQVAPNQPEVGDNASEPPSEAPLIANPDALYEDEFYETLLDETDAPSATDVTFAQAVDDRPIVEESVARSEFVEQPDNELEQADATTDFDLGLFAGLTEFEGIDKPASAPSDTTSLPRSVENQLLRPPAPPQSSPHETLDSFFSPPINEEDAGKEIETIAALTDLIPPDNIESQTFVEPPRLLDLADQADAAPLREDWFLAEPVDGVNNDSTPAATDTADWTLGDWQDTPAVEPVQPTPGIEWSLTDIPSILLSQPFSGEMTVEDLLFADEFLEGAPSNPATRESTADSTAESAPSAELEPPADDPLGSTLEEWFSAVDTDPAVTPEAARDDNRTPQTSTTNTTGFTLEDLTDNSAQATSDETEDLNAFTLDGLDSLFEGVPSIDSAPPPSDTDTQTVTVNNLFDNWNDPSPDLADGGNQSIDPASQAPSSTEVEQQKKKLRFRKSGE